MRIENSTFDEIARHAIWANQELTYKVTTILFTVLVIITEQKPNSIYSVINFVKSQKQ